MTRQRDVRDHQRNDNNYFAIDSDGKVTLTTRAWRRSTAMRRGPNQPDAGVTASDGTNTSSESQVTVNITRVNDNAPTIDTRRQHRDRRVVSTSTV
ncbi:hypothetical protein [Vibrio vulnificus]|uniref:hypothetical protein n=1 Tax=Vibrio vulnificus TaxID=672 RepID=UPI000B0C7640|nr:hypothetical protein [Vibrio vulnificus]